MGSGSPGEDSRVIYSVNKSMYILLGLSTAQQPSAVSLNADPLKLKLKLFHGIAVLLAIERITLIYQKPVKETL